MPSPHAELLTRLGFGMTNFATVSLMVQTLQIVALAWIPKTPEKYKLWVESPKQSPTFGQCQSHVVSQGPLTVGQWEDAKVENGGQNIFKPQDLK